MAAKKRTIIQISVMSPALGDGSAYWGRIYALCDDGTLWVKIPDSEASSQWDRVPDVPAEG